MAQGKQISFALGEVSPALRFRADANFYSQALHKAYNAYIRKSGGASNKAGTLLLQDSTGNPICDYQENIPASASDNIGVRLFDVKATDGSDFILELKNDFTEPFAVYRSSNNLIYAPAYSTWASGSMVPSWYPALPDVTKIYLEEATCTSRDGYAIVTVPVDIVTLGVTTKNYAVFSVVIPEAAGVYTPVWLVGYPTPIVELEATAITGATTGLDPNLPVNYEVYAEDFQGIETLFNTFSGATGHPHSQRSTTLTADLPATLPSGREIKQYNFYRASSANAHFALVGRVAAGGNASTFSDYLTLPELTSQPPSDTTLVTNFINMRKFALYKERAVYAPASSASIPNGTINCSKIGAISMFPRPLTPNLIDAFSFTIPVDKLSIITNFLVMNRLVVFTAYTTHVIRGGQGGVLTAQEINPELIYHEGCSSSITPVAAGSRGYFVSYDGSKLLLITQQRDDAIQVNDVSIYSDHLFEAKDIRQLAVVNGSESVLWILKKDGTLISLTVSEDGAVLGYATHDTDGFIECIAAQETDLAIYDGDTETQKSQTLLLSVNRKGVRCYEKMAIRNDTDVKRFLYADSAVTFGRIANTDELTIQSDTEDYSGGATVNIFSADLFDASWADKVIDFFYDRIDNEGNVNPSKVRLFVDMFSSTSTLIAHAEEDIPETFQNVATTEWLEAFESMTGLEHLAGQEVSLFADGMVIASPNNSNYDTLVVDVTGVLNFPEGEYYNWGYAGLPYTTEIETLNLEAQDARTFTDVGKLINRVGVGVNKTMGGFVGQTGVTELTSMEEFRTRRQTSVEEASLPYSGYLDIPFLSSWEATGRVLFKQVDPLPMSILAVYPKGVIGD